MPHAPKLFKNQPVGKKKPKAGAKTEWAKKYGKRWARLRRQKIVEHVAQNGPYCACGCGSMLVFGQPKHPNNAEVDHIVRHNGVEELFSDLSNMQVLTKRCHSRKTFKECGIQQQGSKRPRTDIDKLSRGG